MSNYSYLCCSSYKGIYSSARSRAFDPAKHTVACDIDCVPLLWLALFRVPNLRRSRFIIDGEATNARAPFVETPLGLAQLRAAVPTLNELLEGLGGVDEHAKMLEEAVVSTGGGFLTVELEEVASLFGEGEFFPLLQRALSFLDDPAKELRRGHRVASSLSAKQRLELIRTVHSVTQTSISEVKRVLEEKGYNVRAAIRTVDERRTHAQRAADCWCNNCLKKSTGGLLPEPDIREVLAELTQVDFAARVLSPSAFWREADGLTKAEYANFVHLLGVSQDRPVPWEPEGDERAVPAS